MASHRASHRPGHAPRRSALAWRGRTAAVLYLVSLAAACGFPETGTPVSVSKAEMGVWLEPGSSPSSGRRRQMIIT